MPDRWVLKLPLAKPLMTLNMQRRSHWSVVARAKSDTALLVGMAVKSAKLTAVDGPVSVRLVWYAPDARRRDVDGLAPMMKAVLDSLVELGVIPDDSSSYVYDVKLGPIVVARDNPRFEVTICKKEVEGVDS